MPQPSQGYDRWLRRILLFAAVLFAGIFWALCNVRYCDDLTATPQSAAVPSAGNVPVVASLR